MKTSVEYAVSLINPNYKHVLEFGVCGGRTLNMIVAELDRVFPGNDLKVFGFDTFTGLPEDWVGKNGLILEKGAFTQDAVLPDVPGAKLFPGLFTDTIPEYLKEADTIALLHIDCDMYSSTKVVFDSVESLIASGTIIVFDEWIYWSDSSCDDQEQRAFLEYVEKNNIKFEFVPFNDYENSVERKIVRIL
jgi:Macrocin-O-methyltransferase (TylF)